MIPSNHSSAIDWMRDTEAIEQAMGEAIQDTLREHKLLGYPIVIWRDGKVVWVPPEEIELEEKNGADGALALDSAGRLEVVPAVRIDRVVDTTSCGDSFCAGFIAATLRGRPWHQALRFAAATASLVARGPATLGVLESYEQADGIATAASA